jgi:hypothetical protein
MNGFQLLKCDQKGITVRSVLSLCCAFFSIKGVIQKLVDFKKGWMQERKMIEKRVTPLGNYVN